MKTITQITVQQKNKSRSNLFLNGEYYCALDNFTVVKNGLKTGMQIEEEKLAEIQEESEFSFAFDKLLGYISKYRKTKKQALEYLLGKGYTYPVAYKAVDKACSYGYLSDDDYAKTYVGDYSRKKGKRLMAFELKNKGVDEKHITAALENVNEKQSAKDLAIKYMKNKPLDLKTLSKCYRHILSKGFSYESASDAISCAKRYYSENGDDFTDLTDEE